MDQYSGYSAANRVLYLAKSPDLEVGAAMKRMEKLLLDSKSFFKVLQLYISLKVFLLST